MFAPAIGPTVISNPHSKGTPPHSSETAAPPHSSETTAPPHSSETAAPPTRPRQPYSSELAAPLHSSETAAQPHSSPRQLRRFTHTRQLRRLTHPGLIQAEGLAPQILWGSNIMFNVLGWKNIEARSRNT